MSNETLVQRLKKNTMTFLTYAAITAVVSCTPQIQNGQSFSILVDKDRDGNKNDRYYVTKNNEHLYLLKDGKGEPIYIANLRATALGRTKGATYHGVNQITASDGYIDIEISVKNENGSYETLIQSISY